MGRFFSLAICLSALATSLSGCIDATCENEFARPQSRQFWCGNTSGFAAPTGYAIFRPSSPGVVTYPAPLVMAPTEPTTGRPPPVQLQPAPAIQQPIYIQPAPPPAEPSPFVQPVPIQ